MFLFEIFTSNFIFISNQRVRKYIKLFIIEIKYYRQEVSFAPVCIAFSSVVNSKLATNIKCALMDQQKSWSATTLILVITVCATTVLGKLVLILKFVVIFCFQNVCQLH